MSVSTASLHRPPQPFVRPVPDAAAAISVLDAFSHMCFRNDLQLWPIEPLNVETDFDLIQPDFVLVESAWNGNSGSWLHELTGSSGPKPRIVALLDEARRRGIPTVFWNKEDPPHFDDFLPLARRFDHVFTTEGSLVGRYAAEGSGSAQLMQFAASPVMHNPIRVSRMRAGGICFGGQYFRHKYPERRAQMDMLFAGVGDKPLSIYSRVLGGDDRYQFPEELSRHVVGSLPYEEMVHEYKRHKVFLNVNSVPDSETMCARRIFELAACKTVVVSPRSRAIAATFAADEVLLVDSAAEASDALQMVLDNPLERAQIGQRAWRRVAGAHLYTHRVSQILAATGISSTKRRPELTVVLTAAQTELVSALETIATQRLGDLIEGPLHVLVRSRDGGQLDLPESRFPQFRIAHATPDSMELKLRTEAVVASMDASHRYGPAYLADHLLLLAHFPVGDVVTKSTWSDFEAGRVEQHVNRIRRGTWLATSDMAPALLEQEQQGVNWIDANAYAADPFELVAHGETTSRTWTA